MASIPVRSGGTDTPGSADHPVMRLLDAIDRARLTPLEALVLVHVAAAEATVVGLADQLARRPVDVRRAITRLAARGLLRRRSGGTGSWGLTFGATAAGLDFVRSVGLESALAGGGAADGHRPAPPEQPRQRPLGRPARETRAPAQTSSAPRFRVLDREPGASPRGDRHMGPRAVPARTR